MRSSRVYQITRTTRLCPCPLWSGLSALQAVGPSGAPAAKDVLLALGGVGDLSRAVGQADEEGRLLLELALVAGDGDLGLDREGARADVDAADVLAVDRVDLDSRVAGGCLAQRGDEDVRQVELEQVPVVLARLPQGGVVAVQTDDGAVVGHADEQRAAVGAVQERGDGLDRRGLQRLVLLAALPGPQRRLVLEVLGLPVRAEQLADRAV